MGGVFITMEGVEGSGKSTQLQRLCDRLRALSVPLVVSKEPGGTALGRELRSLLLTSHASGENWCPESELLLFYADRAQHLAQVVRPGLQAGKVVLVDRFEDSTRAYQGARGVAELHLDRLSDMVLQGLRTDLTLILDMDPEASLKRVEARNGALGASFTETRFDQEALSFHRKVREGFLAIAKKEPQRAVLLPADQPLEAVEAAIWAHVSAVLTAKGHHV